MADAYAVTLASMHQDMTRLNHVALNLANVSTPGYKREAVAVQPFVDVVDALLGTAAGNPHDAMASGVLVDNGAQAPGALQVRHDMRPGTIKMTGEPLDLALTGDGFFEVSTPSGPAYTRQGNFRLDGQGHLVTAQGYPVMGKGGDIYLTTQTPSIDTQGAITEPDTMAGPNAPPRGTPVAQLRIVQFEHPEKLSSLGNGLMSGNDRATAVAEGSVQIRQGALENANVDSMQEMMELMRTMRHFESMQKIAQGYDEMLGLSLQKLGDLS
ncbi:flagellar hook-basal body protein [Paraburkholderia acidicola]|uniref:Flagellar hook-basal body protein n=1 Tax=Paraburkholderia acidicola TaxID=1912599 RepID=A0A2A4ETG4_9BURK|nr:flagellar hook-basal body protein [Paraburkholderia acidicola]PCE23722.1 flagellar hook-basal body protein [Paraburkholderia acidicola]